MSKTITVQVRLFALLREALGFTKTTLTLPAGSDVASLLAHLAEAYPAAHLPEKRFTVAVNRAYALPERVLAAGDEVALIPPVSGGSGAPENSGTGKLFEVVERPISIDEVAARVTAPDRGGITLFVGTVRGITGDMTTDYLEYEAYPEMAEATLAKIGAEVQTRWPAVSAVSIVHRVGRLEIGETAVVIAVAAAHRRDTFDACHYAIDRVKQIAPIWKREIGPDGAVWAAGSEPDVE